MLALAPMEPAGYELVRLNSGVYSVRSGCTAETFHPVVGPAAEAEALYVRQLRLRERLMERPPPSLSSGTLDWARPAIR
jgi:hypothetical protein